MKKSFIILAVMSLLVVYPVESQGLLNKVKNAVSKEVSSLKGDNAGRSNDELAPEPACACSDAKLIVDLGTFKLDYKEISVSMKDDGSLLIRDRIGNKYYVVKDGSTRGPYNENDPQVKEFDSVNEEAVSDNDTDAWLKRFPAYITRSGDKYTIKFAGKSYGPYALIQDFAVARSNDKFAAIVTENVVVTEDQGRKMEEAMKNAKTDQERMELAMKMSQQMQNQIMQGNGPGSLQPQIVSNVPGATFDMSTSMGGRLNSKVKFDDILLVAPDRIIDLKGNTVIKLPQNTYDTEGMFVNSSNSRYATYKYGALTFSDNTKLSDLFNPYLSKTDGKVYLNYMYYSPGKNALMLCGIPF